ncbi:MAG TPA: rhodanese-like domain-containing protein [Aquabacterium sp.]|uniref:oxygen-dependent tRNA uridine(34) hydroxylase TrhO n=1 Tax=Aquabacterium sp. TaxID=1872578 RepID=UPI002E342B92|nr:rhodanese-like domain-containing protein [Aquabacterium sp.]HEX5371378.1 rhodanese-like domain-containing protein [Aquabacterium sp.]
MPEPTPDTLPLIHSSFYRFVALPAPDAVVEILRELVAPLTGSVLVAHEGISGALAATEPLLAAFEHAVQHDPRLGGAFLGMPFKHSACTTRPFWKVRVHRKDEIVALGVDGVTGVVRDRAEGKHLSPSAWRDLLAQDKVVVIDNRNSFEYRLGRFKNAIDPRVDNFRDFPAYVQAHADTWKAEGQRVAMYCTGGIRCEKTSAWMQHELGLDVYQLDGGIVNFFQALPDADRDWEGELFVFDNRVAIDTHLQETATTADQVYNDSPDERWRLERARRLDSVNPKT